MTMSGYQYNTAGGETFDSIAREVYGNEKYAAELMCANPHLTDLSVFTGQEAILLPQIDLTDAVDELPAKAPWEDG